MNNDGAKLLIWVAAVLVLILGIQMLEAVLVPDITFD